MEFPRDILQSATAAQQAHVLEDWPSLTEAERTELLQNLKQLDFKFVNRIFDSSVKADGPRHDQLSPVEGVMERGRTSEQQEAEWRQIGYRLIAEVRQAKTG